MIYFIILREKVCYLKAQLKKQQGPDNFNERWLTIVTILYKDQKEADQPDDHVDAVEDFFKDIVDVLLSPESFFCQF